MSFKVSIRKMYPYEIENNNKKCIHFIFLCQSFVFLISSFGTFLVLSTFFFFGICGLL